MLIHFAFGRLRNDPEQQALEFVDKILHPKKLKVSKCMEFCPVFPKPGYHIDPTKFELTKSETHAHLTVKLNRESLIPIAASDISYRPHEVPMVCFIEIPFNKLKSSPHGLQYGQLGVAFTKSFFKRLGVTPVQYYTEESLYTDPLIKEWNSLQEKKDKTPQDLQRLKQLISLITAFRKPQFLWGNFQKAQSIVLKISTDGKGGAQHKLYKYDDYPLGYDFREERECRIAFGKDSYPEHVNFEESDILKIIVPNEQIKALIEDQLKINYARLPEIVVFPS